MDDDVLAQARRGHDAQATRTAVARLREAGYEIGLQMMIGLPGDTAQGALATAQAIVALQPDFVRIYPTLVLPGSALADDFRAGRYRPLSLDASVALTCRLLQLFTARGIRVARMGLPAEIRPVDARSWLAGPHHPAFGDLVYGRLYLALAAAALASAPRRGSRARLRVHPKRVSALTGQNRCNIIQLQQRFDLSRIDIATVADLPLNRLEVDMLPTL
jgi:histone acetyltransferase (RNA polymerase elongator complex component)